MANKHMKSCSTSLVSGDAQIKITGGEHMASSTSTIRLRSSLSQYAEHSLWGQEDNVQMPASQVSSWVILESYFKISQIHKTVTRTLRLLWELTTCVQHGFCPLHSTEAALLMVTSGSHVANSNGHISIFTFLRRWQSWPLSPISNYSKLC